MLSPVRPSREVPDYDEKIRRFRQQKKNQRRHPEKWGVVRPASQAPTAGTQAGGINRSSDDGKLKSQAG